MSVVSDAVIAELSEEIATLEAAIALAEPRDPDLAGRLRIVLRHRHCVLDTFRPGPARPGPRQPATRSSAPSRRGARGATSGTLH
ncbi:hypothetical protein [Methylocella sp.]|uniref:hypothetical protein n=1 Tax=Methylocella sp. TaxID=1978226 RepID=UPI0035AF1ED3